MIHTFELAGGGKIELNCENVLEFDYRITQPDGLIRLKYPNSPEFTIKNMPVQRTVSDLAVLGSWLVKVNIEIDVYGMNALVDAWEKQLHRIQAASLTHFGGLAEVCIGSGTHVKAYSGWDYMEYELTIRETDLGALKVNNGAYEGPASERIDSLVNAFNRETLESFMLVTQVKNLPNVTWFGPPDENPYDAVKSVIEALTRPR